MPHPRPAPRFGQPRSRRFSRSFSMAKQRGHMFPAKTDLKGEILKYPIDKHKDISVEN
jgi:hypothetical protein